MTNVTFNAPDNIGVHTAKILAGRACELYGRLKGMGRVVGVSGMGEAATRACWAVDPAIFMVPKSLIKEVVADLLLRGTQEGEETESMQRLLGFLGAVYLEVGSDADVLVKLRVHGVIQMATALIGLVLEAEKGLDAKCSAGFGPEVSQITIERPGAKPAGVRFPVEALHQIILEKTIRKIGDRYVRIEGAWRTVSFDLACDVLENLNEKLLLGIRVDRAAFAQLAATAFGWEDPEGTPPAEDDAVAMAPDPQRPDDEAAAAAAIQIPEDAE